MPLDNVGTFWEHRPGLRAEHAPGWGGTVGVAMNGTQVGGGKRETRSDHAPRELGAQRQEAARRVRRDLSTTVTRAIPDQEIHLEVG
jgi:hypothetical protein